MTEIHVTRKRSKPRLILLAVVVIGMLVWGSYEFYQAQKNARARTEENDAMRASPPGAAAHNESV